MRLTLQIREFLLPISSRKHRDKYFKKAILNREIGNLKTALYMFCDVEKWDIYNQFPLGQIECLIATRIVLKKLSNKTSNPRRSFKLREIELQLANKAIQICQDYTYLLAYKLPCVKMVKASAMLNYSLILENKTKQYMLEAALEYLEEAVDLSLDINHKKWSLNTKSKILMQLGKTREALECLSIAERLTLNRKLVNKNNYTKLHPIIWLTGIYLSFSGVYAKSGETALSKEYANQLLNVPDPLNIISHRKVEALRILNFISI